MNIKDLKKLKDIELKNLAKKEGIDLTKDVKKTDIINLLLKNNESKINIKKTSKKSEKKIIILKEKNKIKNQNNETLMTFEKSNKYDFQFELPETYGRTHITLMSRDPYWIFSYWNVSKMTIDELKKAYTKININSLKLCLQVIKKDVQKETFISEILPDYASNNYYIKIPEAGHKYYVDLGFLTQSEEFIFIARSNIVETPNDSISHHIDNRWITHENFISVFSGVESSDSSFKLPYGQISSNINSKDAKYRKNENISTNDLSSFNLSSQLLSSGNLSSAALSSLSLSSFSFSQEVLSSSLFSSASFSSQILNVGVLSSFSISSGELSSFSLSSGILSSGMMLNFELSSGKISSFQLSSGQLSSQVLSSGILKMGLIAETTLSSGILSSFSLSSGILSSGAFSSIIQSFGVLSSGVLSSGVLSSGVLSSGVLSSGVLSSGVLSSGVLSSGVLSSGVLSSGVLIDYSSYYNHSSSLFSSSNISLKRNSSYNMQTNESRMNNPSVLAEKMYKPFSSYNINHSRLNKSKTIKEETFWN